MSVTISDFGRAADGTPVRKAVLKNQALEAHIISYGAILHRLYVKDKNGKPVDVVLGYPTAPDYELNHSDAMGSVVGRFANRIGGAAFYLYEKEYHVTANEHGNCLHSGLHGFAGTVFDMEPLPDEEEVLALIRDASALLMAEMMSSLTFLMARSFSAAESRLSVDTPTADASGSSILTRVSFAKRTSSSR